MKISDEQVRRVLEELREDGRASYTHVARRVGVARQAVSEAVNAALDAGRMRLTVNINPKLLGIARYSYLLIRVSGPSDPVLRTLNEMPETCFVSAITGPYGIDAEVRVGSDEEHHQLLGRIRELPQVTGVVCSAYEKILVNIDSPLPEPGDSAVQIDEIDRRILYRLESDGRATFKELGHAAGISAAGARTRMLRLREHRLIKVVGMPVRDHQIDPPPLGLGLRVRGHIDEALVADIRAVSPEFLASSSGPYDLIATFSATTHEGLLAKLDTLRSLDAVTEIDSWSHLRIVKEHYGISGLSLAGLESS